MSGVVPAIPRLKFTNAAGVPVASGSVTVYLAGTTTLANTYQDKALTIQNNNPVPLDGNGEALFWLDPSLTYKFLLKDAGNANVSGWPVDNILGGGQAPTLQQSHVDTFSGNGVNKIFTLSAAPASINDTNVYVAGVYQDKALYNLSGNTITFVAAPGITNVEVTYYVLLDFTGLAATIAGYSAAALTSASDAQTSALAASTSETNAAGSVTAINNRIYPGTYTVAPTTRPDGSARQSGDEYFDATANKRYTYNGATWVASDINTANLAASSGSSLVGDGTTTVADRLSAINLSSYTALRAYAGANQSAYITGYLVSANPSGTAGLFTRDDSDTTSADNGGTIIVASNGKRWKRIYSGGADVRWFGVKGDGTTDDTTASANALAASKHVIVPAGMTPLISSTIAVPVATRLQFLGGFGNTSSAYPASYFVKKSTMTTPAVTVADRAWVDGGGIVCQAGNTGEGLQIIGNSAKVSNFFVHAAGGDGVRVGTAGGANVNSFSLEHVTSQYNGGHGFNIHDGTASSGANANAGPLQSCFAQYNTGDGIHIGHAWWIKLDTCLTENNTGWGLYLSGTANNTYPECRWVTVIGGDFNETNTAGQIYDGSYFSTFVQPDANNIPTTAPTGVQGGGYRSIIAGNGASVLQGLYVDTSCAGPGARPLIAYAGPSGGNVYPVLVKQRTTASNGDGAGIKFQSDPNTGVYRDAAAVTVRQISGTQDSLVLAVNDAGALRSMLTIDPNSASVRPSSDNAYTCGSFGNRWSVVYAATGAINTSDARSKQQARTLNDAERAVAVACKGLLRAFKFNDAVEKKGDGARWHFGVIAQEVGDAFRAQGLDPAAYGLFCHDEWPANGEQPAGDRYGVRYEELLAFMLAAL